MLDRRRALTLSLAAILTDRRLASAADRSVRLVFVHGRGQAGLQADTLKAAWLAALTAGAKTIGKTLPSAIEVSFPFYGDVLETFVTKAKIPLTSDVVARGGQPNDDFLAFQAEIAQAMRVKAGITDNQVLAEYGNNPRPRGPLNWDWVQAIIRAIDKHGGSLSSGGIEQFTRDVYLYVNVAAAREAVDAIVRASLDEGPTVVVAHSLGTVVAYDVLRADPRQLNIPLFVTLGSPLGIRAIRDQLVPLSHPARVAAWYNAFDTRDVVSLYPLDDDNFPVDPAIENFGGVRNHTDNRHGIDGYLDDTHVAAKILAAFGG